MTHNLREDTFSQLFITGAVRHVDVQIGSNGRATVHYLLQNGVQGIINTKRGGVKEYKPETCMRFLRMLGFTTLKLDMSAWHPSAGQHELL